MLRAPAIGGTARQAEPPGRRSPPPKLDPRTGPPWRSVEETVETWCEAGSPEQQDFTLTITSEAQTVRLNNGGHGPTWTLPRNP